MTANKKAATTISFDIVRMLLKYVSGLGIDPNELIQQVNLDPTLFSGSECFIRSDQFDELWRVVFLKTNDSFLGLHFGESLLNFSSSHILMGTMLNCATIRDALERFCRYHGLIGDESPPNLREESNLLVFTLSSCRQQPIDYLETVLTSINMIVLRLSENRVKPVEIHLTRQKPSNISEYKRIFNTRLCFNSPYSELVYTSEALSTPIFLAKPVVLDAFDSIAQKMIYKKESATWHDMVTETITQILRQGDIPRLSNVAKTLLISPRYLQEKLRSEGNTFQGLLDKVRKQIALDFFKQGDLPLYEVAYLLGFSEQSAFNHAFKRWTGYKPGDYLEKTLK